MTSRSFQCPSCGAPILPKGSASVLNCPYCRASVVVPEELRQDPAEGKWSTLVYDAFISNHNDWMLGEHDSEYFSPLRRTIADGRYRWTATVGSKTTTIATSWLTGFPVADFHLLVNCKHTRGSKTGSGWGALFRIQDNDNYLNFRITDNRLFGVSLKKEGAWITLVEWTHTDAIKPNGVNQLEVVAYQDRFTLLINGQIVRELDDTQFKNGLVGMAVEGYTSGDEIDFDFLDITLRAP